MPSFVPFSLLVASIGVAVMIYFLVRGTAAADTALKARAVAEVNVLANRVAASVEVNQGKDAELQLDPVRNDADLVYLQILRSDGTVFARYPSKEGPKAADSVQPAAQRGHSPSPETRLPQRSQVRTTGLGTARTLPWLRPLRCAAA